ncbi:glycoside hydrolase family 16 protein [Dendrothele bispora CBS 962.96]|uniref:Glycoside hydrolase family 16 protein n=1 Tax=Dendrothele bispora (strain CBS 962.96) TaxID=1314807 RepID=A0A4S8M896_DENBC|nr:glycoside hydrolase family 16 protein [Dendrothele bispora CBS 962.96]
MSRVILRSTFVLSVLCSRCYFVDAKSAPTRFEKRQTTTYTLEDMYQGESFFNDWNFFSEPDPTQGLVDYQTRENALSRGLAFVQDGVTVLAVDNTTTVPTGSNRASVRIESKTHYTTGLFIADFVATPFGCSTWPAWWSYGHTDYPNSGELDVIESVNELSSNFLTFWRAGSAQCTFPTSSHGSATGSITDESKCTESTTDQINCAFEDGSGSGWGEGFNNAGGGVYAHLINAEGIKIWHFPRANIPVDIANKNPNPSSWGAPVAQWGSDSCNVLERIVDHTLTINTSLCGSWAGDDDVWSTSGCPGSCAETVANPENFHNARWKINYIAVYQAAT